MDYYKLLDFHREPFSNSPEPDLFYLSGNHWECLQKLEIAIRLRRGLNIVLGEVGTGKTTLCRHLILKLEESDQESPKFIIQLILDPEFPSAREFLAWIAQGYGIALDGAEEDLLSLKEKIKVYLFQTAVKEDKLPLLIIDEGQKLPSYCLETLREFLNYETSDRKLLQIVIFAQIEFHESIIRRPNFVDRVNQILFLKPLGLRETIKLIEFRLQKTSADREGLVGFSRPAYLTLWYLSRGYPRRTLAIAHHVLLTLITQGKRKATRQMVRIAARNLPERSVPHRRRYAWPLVIPLAILVFLGFALYWEKGGLKSGASGKAPHDYETSPSPEAGFPLPFPKIVEPHAWLPAEAKTSPTGPPLQERGKSPAPSALPSFLGSILVKDDFTLSRLAQIFYGRSNPQVIARIMENNRHLTDPNLIKAGDRIIFPTIQAPFSPLIHRVTLIEIDRARNLSDIFDRYREFPEAPAGARILIFWTASQGLSYSLVLRETFLSEAEASAHLAGLEAPWKDKARLLMSRPKETVFITAWQ